MDTWQATFLGLKQLPRELTAFEIEAFFRFTPGDRQVIEERRFGHHGTGHQLLKDWTQNTDVDSGGDDYSPLLLM